LKLENKNIAQLCKSELDIQKYLLIRLTLRKKAKLTTLI